MVKIKNHSLWRIPVPQPVCLASGWWLMLICFERKILLVSWWWLIYFKRKLHVTGGG
jgi:hypothetical protein